MQDPATRGSSEEQERERRSSRRNLAGLLIITGLSLSLIIGDIIKDLLKQ